MAMRRIGGDKLQATLDKFKSEKPIRLEYGYYPNSKYPDGTYVASVAMYNEFGTSAIPERPFFRHANAILVNDIAKIAKKHKTLSSRFAGAVGEIALNNLKQSILGFGIDYAPNSPYTVSSKKSSKPLVDTGKLLNSGAYTITTLGI